MFGKINKSLNKTRQGVFSKINRLVTAKKYVDDDFLESLEEILISGDVGVDTSLFLIEKIVI